MSHIAVVTDSSATVPKEIVQQLDIRVVPLTLTFNGHTMRDGVDLTAGMVYRWLRATKHLPTTSAPSIGDFLRVYASVARDASGIVSIHLSPTLSATYETAVAASRLMDGPPIHVVDCHSAAMGQGFVVMEAARAAAQGADLEGVLDRA